MRRRLLPAAGAVLLVWSSLTPASAAAGDVDTTFADAGLLTQPNANVLSTAMTPGVGGRFVLAWTSATQVGVSGFLGSGTEDGGYGSGGTSAITVPGASYVDVLQAITDGSGRTLAVGFAEFPEAKMLVARFTSTGMPDTSFSGDGLQTIGFAKGESYAYGAAIAHGDIYLSGQVYTSSGVAEVAAVRLDGQGNLDPAFGNGGRAIYDVDDGFAGDDYAMRIRRVGNGRFVMAGGVESLQGKNSLVMRIRGDGRLDPSFGNDGIVILDLRKGDDDYVWDLERDGSKLVLGIRGDTTKPKIVRLLADGSRDATFGTKGVGRYAVGLDLTGIAIDASHRVIAIGYSGHLAAMRVKANGAFSTAFGTGGIASNPATNALGSDVMMQDDLIVVAGFHQNVSINATRYLPA